MLTALQLETHFFTNLIEFSIGRDFGGSEGVNSFTTGNPFFFTNLLEFSTGRDFGGSKVVNNFTTGSPLFFKFT